ncbi:fgf-1 [Spodoptera frugiperda granulovirus]|uniref:Fgf-1 n=1 Tax=Spodoptera frugiperda granulovirus TaxID=307454 RepID=A0A0C5AQ76_9BBAC|nr:fgf-1 [Spodoptera frugiperda granulovirus]AJK91731.1 fgf-1 [Spodoptera frugiperda granulovirus]AXS01093.1 fgf-1 [Spodoptera frugiperda granulovirus]
MIAQLLLTLYLCAAYGGVDANKLYQLLNAHDNMNIFIDSENIIKLTYKTSSPPTQFTITPHNDGLVFMYKLNSVCYHFCMTSCSSLVGNEKYVESECTWTTVAFKQLDTLSQQKGNYTSFLASNGYNFIKLVVDPSFHVNSLYSLINFKIESVTNDKTKVCVFNPKNTGKPDTCTVPFKMSDEKIDTHKSYATITLLDKLWDFLGWYKIKPETPANSLRAMDFNANYK